MKRLRLRNTVFRIRGPFLQYFHLELLTCIIADAAWVLVKLQMLLPTVDEHVQLYVNIELSTRKTAANKADIAQVNTVSQ